MSGRRNVNPEPNVLATVATRDEKNRLVAAGWTTLGYRTPWYVLAPPGTDPLDGAT